MASPFAAVVELADLAAGTGGFKIQGDASFDAAGYAVAGVGDFNGDGIADVLVGAYGADTGTGPSSVPDTGRAYVVFGAAGGLTSPVDLGALGSGGLSFAGEAESDGLGLSVAAAGDVNGDGFSDVIVGASGIDTARVGGSGTVSNNGGGYVVFGSANGFGTLDLATLNGTNGFQILGENVADGLGDSSQFGRAVGGGGDFNGDGFADIIIGGPTNDTPGAPGGFSNAGSAYVIFGKASGFPATLDLVALANGTDTTSGFRIVGENAGDRSGHGVANAGDVNSDGVDDLIVGARFGDSDPATDTEEGAAYVVFGRTAGFGAGVDLDDVAAGIGGFKLVGETGEDYAGYAVAAAGDVNGDGIDDLIIGADQHEPDPEADSDFSSYGAAYVVFGRTGGFTSPIDLADVAAGTGGFKVLGASGRDFAGSSVAAAGDVNGDGYGDVIVGAEGADFGVVDSFGDPVRTGGAYVVFGSAGGFATPVDLGSLGDAGFAIQGENQFDNAGVSVSAAGDVDGDGLDDLIVGAYGNDVDPATGSGEGAAYVLYGRAFIAGPTPQADVLMDGTDGADTTIDLLAGNDSYTGRDGDDTITGNAGADWLRGGTGDDVFQLGGSAGADQLASTASAVLNVDMRGSNNAVDRRTVGGRQLTLDVIDGGLGDDTVRGTAGDDVVVLSAPGLSVFTGQERTERLVSVERFELGSGNDVLGLTTASSEKYTTDVTALGGAGLDALWGGSGDDVLDGGADADNLVGGFGDDRLTGGGGSDVFGFARGFGSDVVTDFGDAAGNQDVLRIKGFGTGLDSFAEIFAASAQVGADTVITLPNGGAGGNTVITLTGFVRTGLDAADFQIVA